MMLSKLRNKFLILNMTLIMLTLFTAFAVVYFVTRTTIDSDNETKLNAAISASIPTENNDYNSKINIIKINSDLFNSLTKNTELMKTFGMPALTLFTDEKGALLEVQSVFGSAFDIGFNPTISIIHSETLEDNIPVFDISSFHSPFMEIALNNQGIAKTANINGHVWLYSVIDIAGNKTQVTFLDITDSANRLNHLMLTFAVVGAIMIIIVFFISLFLANRSIKPVKTAWDKQRQFIADASHELKTPLTVLTSTYSALQANKNETIRSQNEFFGYMKSGMDRMGKLIYSLLHLAQIENTKNNMAKEPFDIGETIQTAIGLFEIKMSEKDIVLSCDLSQKIITNSNKEMVESIFEILFDNAVKYTDKSGKINVKLRREKRSVIFSIGNSGEGIPKKELPKIFERFYRVDVSHSSETSGHGLGLAIAKEAVTQLGGKISADSRDGWTVFTVNMLRLQI